MAVTYPVVGAPLLRTLTLKNLGDSDLKLTEPITLPTGFSLVGVTLFGNPPLLLGGNPLTATVTQRWE